MLLHICYKFWNSRISPLWCCATTQMSRTGAERWMGMWWIPDLVFKETFHCILQHKPFVWKPWWSQSLSVSSFPSVTPIPRPIITRRTGPVIVLPRQRNVIPPDPSPKPSMSQKRRLEMIESNRAKPSSAWWIDKSVDHPETEFDNNPHAARPEAVVSLVDWQEWCGSSRDRIWQQSSCSTSWSSCMSQSRQKRDQHTNQRMEFDGMSRQIEQYQGTLRTGWPAGCAQDRRANFTVFPRELQRNISKWCICYEVGFGTLSWEGELERALLASKRFWGYRSQDPANLFLNVRTIDGYMHWRSMQSFATTTISAGLSTYVTSLGEWCVRSSASNKTRIPPADLIIRLRTQGNNRKQGNNKKVRRRSR